MTTSKLNSALHLAAKGYRVFPLNVNSKTPVIKNFPELATTDKEQITKWFAGKEYNIGISTNDLLVVDVDVKDEKKNGLDTIAGLLKFGKHFPPTTTQTTSTGGYHFIYDTPFPVRNSASKIGAGLDVRGTGGYLVGAGSAINGKTYSINTVSRNMAPNWLLESVSQANTEKPQAHKKIAGVDEEAAKKRGLKYLNDLPSSDEGNRNAEGYKIAATLKDYGVSLEDTFVMMMDEWKCEPPLELEELKSVVTSAYKYGKEAQGSAAPEAMFGTGEEVIEGRHAFEILNDEYAFAMMGGTHRIIHEFTDKKGVFNVQYLNEDTFHKKLAARKFQTSDGNSKPLTKSWMGSPLRRSYDEVVFLPGLTANDNQYNLWRGFAVKPLEKDEQPTETMIEAVRKFEEHLFINVADENLEYYNWIYGWFAHIVQKPWEKPGVALVMKGRKGVGKNILLDSVGNLFKPNYMVTANKRHLVGTFNSHMEHLLLLVLDEAFWSGSKEDEGILKSLVTQTDVTIERKGLDSHKAVSYVRTAVIGNEDWIVPASDDERRYAVFKIGESRMQDTKFFTAFREGMEQGGYRYLLTKLLQFDLLLCDVRNAPDTAELYEQKQNSLAPLASWWLGAITQGYIEGIASIADGEWQCVIDRKNLFDTFSNYVRSRRNSTWLGSDAKILKDLQVFIPAARSKRRPGELEHLEFPPLDECRKAWDKHMKTKTEWRK